MIKKKILSGMLGLTLAATSADFGGAQEVGVPSGAVKVTPSLVNQAEPKAAPQLIPGMQTQPGVRMQMPTPVPGLGGPGMMPPMNMYPMAQGPYQDPTPIGGGGPGANMAMQPPPMPPYAWPTFAPYNNYSRVAYPLYYPYDAWPYIGPQYPFPRVPLGWRSVNLTWQDGHWYFHRTATGHDWWRIRYW